ncbi:tail fiber assembly protein [Xenorhabdus szentirmaii]|uniref:Tail fiber assembly protein n=2 Tax=Xenorhabdus szentirmaii TaxID=290112 RepID=W1J7J0_9GAMM|nr:tail fiber assembly protein [Xenorhabdus szentirmaii]PHM32028.1 tail assembly chaperone [Xenorhabdus szentirmaii DSM 16338]CDL85435.1 conserved hypothetical protein [Xenorhabdus szentirmaii DSM 16338]
MKMKYYYYSPSKNVFYLFNNIDGVSLPADGIRVDETVYAKFAPEMTPKGKHLVAGPDGLPMWTDIPGPTPEQLQRQADYERKDLIRAVREHLEPLQDAAYLDVATEEEKAALTAWHRYRLALYRLDITMAPDIDWPQKPE